MDGLIWLVVGMAIVGAAVYFSKSLGKKGTALLDDSERVQGFPFQKKEKLLSSAERSFYGVLRNVANARGWDVFAKVRLEDLIEVRKGTEKWQAHRNRIKSRHVDFLVMVDVLTFDGQCTNLPIPVSAVLRGCEASVSTSCEGGL